MTADRPRIVSLLPSLTETIAALGLADRLVGRSHDCDHPPVIRRLPVCTSTRIDPAAPGAVIDDDVKTLLAAALSPFAVDIDALAALRPTHVLTQTQCDVCAVPEADVVAALAGLGPSRPLLFSASGADLEGVWADIIGVATFLGVAERGVSLVGAARERLAAVERRVAGRARPRVATLEWLDPPMAAGNWIPELIDIAGGTALFGSAGAHSLWLDWQALIDADPDVVVAMPCGFDIARSRAEMASVTRRPGWTGLAAVRQGRVVLADGSAYFNRPGPRLVESAEILAEILHPDVADFGHGGRGWERFGVA